MPMVTFLLFLENGITKMAVWKTTVHSCPSILTQFRPNRLSVLYSLHTLLAAVLVIPANNSPRENLEKSAKHTVDYLSRVFFPTCTHLH